MITSNVLLVTNGALNLIGEERCQEVHMVSESNPAKKRAKTSYLLIVLCLPSSLALLSFCSCDALELSPLSYNPEEKKLEEYGNIM